MLFSAKAASEHTNALGNISERVSWCDVVYEHDAVGAAVVRRCDIVEPLLSGSVPNLELHTQTRNTSIRTLTYRQHSNGSTKYNVCVSVFSTIWIRDFSWHETKAMHETHCGLLLVRADREVTFKKTCLIFLTSSYLVTSTWHHFSLNYWPLDRKRKTAESVALSVETLLLNACGWTSLPRTPDAWNYGAKTA